MICGRVDLIRFFCYISAETGSLKGADRRDGSGCHYHRAFFTIRSEESEFGLVSRIDSQSHVRS